MRSAAARGLVILALGFVSGMQTALYLYDYYDDGVADVRSLLIGLGMLAVSVWFTIRSFRPKADAGD